MRFSVSIEVFNHYKLNVYVGEKELSRYKKATNYKDGEVDGMDYVTGLTYGTNIYLKNGNLGTLVHELHHAVTYLMKNIGAKDEEVEAYVSAYLFEQCYKKIKDYKGDK